MTAQGVPALCTAHIAIICHAKLRSVMARLILFQKYTLTAKTPEGIPLSSASDFGECAGAARLRRAIVYARGSGKRAQGTFSARGEGTEHEAYQDKPSCTQVAAKTGGPLSDGGTG